MESLKNSGRSTRARGVTMVEYALLISVMAVGASFGFRYLGAGVAMSVFAAQAPLSDGVQDTVLLNVPRARGQADRP